MIYSEFMIFIYVIISLLTLVLFALLSFKYFKDRNINYRTHSLTKLLLFLIFFLFMDSFIFLLETPDTLLYTHLNPIFDLISKGGIFFSLVLITHFLMERRIEEFKNNEKALFKLEKLNKELETKTKKMETFQEKQEKKLHELERFNEIAKKREAKMIDLIKKINILEAKLKKKRKKSKK